MTPQPFTQSRNREPELVREVLADGGRLLAEFAGTANADGVGHLLDLGVGVDARYDGDGYFDIAKDSTALHVAAWKAWPNVVTLLLARGASVNVADGKGRSPLVLAVKACVDWYWTGRRTPASVEALLRAGASTAGVVFPTGYDKVDDLLRAFFTGGREFRRVGIYSRRATTDATIAPSTSPSRARRISSGLTSAASSPGFRRKCRVGGTAALGLADEERLVDQDATRRERAHQVRDERPVQVARDDNHVELVGAQVDLRRLEIHRHDPYVELEPKRLRAESIECIGVTIDGRHLEARRGKQQRVPALSAGDVEHAAAGGQQVGVVDQPRRRPRRWGPDRTRALRARPPCRRQVRAPR